MKILVIGASGLVGSNFVQVLRKESDYEVAGTWFSYQVPDYFYYNTLDLENDRNFDITAYRPDIIIHTGALTHVDYCENHIEESYRNIVLSTKNIVEIASRLGSKVIYISTDYVFDGQNGPYTEESKVNPINVYGQHKLEAEEIIRAQMPDHLILRVTNVYGHEIRRKNFVARVIDLCKKNEIMELKLPIDQFATPINASDIAKAGELLIQNRKNGTYHLAGTDYLSRVQLALKIKTYFNPVQIIIKPLFTSSMLQDANRPLFGGLKSAKFLSEFPLFQFGSIDQYLESES
jgi:dTDP-4-dehydrorhamnose reductase